MLSKRLSKLKDGSVRVDETMNEFSYNSFNEETVHFKI